MNWPRGAGDAPAQQEAGEEPQQQRAGDEQVDGCGPGAPLESWPTKASPVDRDGGHHLARRMDGVQLYGLTTPLLLKSGL